MHESFDEESEGMDVKDLHLEPADRLSDMDGA